MQVPTQIGPYQIERLLGFGSFATVWLGFEPVLGAHVAIKVLADNWCHDLRVRERFLDEGRLLWRLDHERLVRVHAVGELADGRPYLVMAWARGGSLRDRLVSGPLPVRMSLLLLREIAAGAAVLHQQGIVHRDLTPGNVLFRSVPAEAPADGYVGQVLIADLGLAKALAAASGLTARAGTPGFMAPEQDDPMAILDVRTDVFGLGRLGMVLLCVSPSRPGTRALRPGVPADVGRVLRKATSNESADRYPDAAAFGVALGRAAGLRRSVAGGRRRAVLCAIVLAAAVLATANAAEPVGPRLTDTRTAVSEQNVPVVLGPQPSSSPSSASPSPSPSPTPTRGSGGTPKPNVTPCRAESGRTLTADADLSRVPQLCLTVGAVLQVEGAEPGSVSAPTELVEVTYPGGVARCRFLAAGPVTVTIVRQERSYPVRVTVVKSATPSSSATSQSPAVTQSATQ
jgi:serine/threonine protein kinase